MNILILTGKFGMGHYSAAEAIKEELMLRHQDVNAEIVDLLEHVAPICSGAIYGGFNFLVSRCAGLYNFLGGIASRCSVVPMDRVSIKKVERLLQKHQPDLVVSTLPLCSQYIAAYKKTSGSDLPLYTYVTDIEIHEEWLAKGTDRYFVGDSFTAKALTEKGVPEQCITISGIPVKQAFKRQQGTAKTGGKKQVLIMGGGLGLTPVPDAWLKELCNRQDVEVTLIAGKNRALQARIQQEFPEINVLGYTKQVHDYMGQADLIISKSGGITTFEAIFSETPVFAIKPFLMQEIGNAQFIQRKGIGRVDWKKSEQLPEALIQLLEDDQKREELRDNMQRLKRGLDGRSPLTIYETKGMGLCG